MGLNPLEMLGVTAPLAGDDDFGFLDHLWYEGDNRSCFIIPSLVRHDPKSGRVGLRFGSPPEELHLKHLRPEQRTFFEQHLPDVVRRFKQV